MIMTVSPKQPIPAKITSSLPGNKQIRLFMDKLTATSNVAQYVNLPTIVVMGDPHSGKTSLLSSISGIDLPSSSEATKRSPIMLEMKNADTYSAQVSVILKETHNTSTGPVWTKSISETEWGTLKSAIQTAKDITGNYTTIYIVSVQVNGPRFENLALVALPGIVRSGGTYHSDFQALLDEYIQNKHCIVLLVVPGNTDFQHCQILAEASILDPGTAITIPIITKTDLIDHKGQKHVKNLLFGLKREKFAKGFHLVKGRNQAEWNRQETLQNCLVNEQQYFDNSLPWKDILDRSCFGTKNLRIKLGELFIELIRASLSDTIQDFMERKEMALTKLKHLSVLYNTPTEKRHFVNEVIGEVRKHVSFDVCGNAVNAEHAGIVRFYEACDIFKAKINNRQLANILAGYHVMDYQIGHNGYTVMTSNKIKSINSVITNRSFLVAL